MVIQNRGEVHTGHEDIITHVLLSPDRLGSAEIRGDGDGGCARHITIQQTSVAAIDIFQSHLQLVVINKTWRQQSIKSQVSTNPCLESTEAKPPGRP